MIKNIKMKENTRGSQDGRHIENFLKGEVYGVVDELASVFVDIMKVAEYTDEEPVIVEEKSAGAAPENKMAEGPSDDKEEVGEEKKGKGEEEGGGATDYFNRVIRGRKK